MRFSTSSSSEMPKISLIMRAAMQIFTGVFDFDALEEYKIENGSSSIAGKISFAKVLPRNAPMLFVPWM